jgi:hypothetical protein
MEHEDEKGKERNSRRNSTISNGGREERGENRAYVEKKEGRKNQR